MEFINILILSLIQGITEFLPISSSSHLILVPILTNFSDQGILFDIALHTGSLLAILAYFRKEIKEIINFTQTGKDYIKLIILASIPLPIIGIISIDFITSNFRDVQTIAVTTIFFALVLLLADIYGKHNKNIMRLTTYGILIIGLMQTLALVPGVSRSGIVISTALLLNFTRSDAIKIAFLLSIPAIFMASTYNIFTLYQSNDLNILIEHLLGISLSFLFSYLTIYFFISTINKISFSPYIIYRIVLGSFLLFI